MSGAGRPGDRGPWDRRLVPVGLVFVLAMVGFGAVAVARGNGEFVFYGLVMVGIAGLVWWMDRRVRLSAGVLWGLLVWAILHLAGGNVPIPDGLLASPMPGEGVRSVLYSLRVHERAPKYDQVVHAVGFAVATLAGWEALRAASAGSLRPTFGVRVALVCVGMGLGAINEVVEFAATRFMDTNVGGYENTGWDLVSNLCGCVVAASLVRRGRSERVAAS